MRVLMVTEFYPPLRGGLEFHVQSLARELNERGHDIHVATLGAGNGQSNDGGVTVHYIRSTASRLPFSTRTVRDRSTFPSLTSRCDVSLRGFCP